jgi:hypothetical protein
MSNQEAKISATLPKTEHANGLHAIAADLIDSPEAVRYAVVRFDTGEIQHKFEIDEEGERYQVMIPKARIRAIEPLTGTDADAASRLMDAARAERMGELPYHAVRGLALGSDGISGD